MNIRHEALYLSLK